MKFVEFHVDLADRWDCGIDLVSKTDDDTLDYYGELLEPLETGDDEFDRHFDIRLQLPESIKPVLLSDPVRDLLRDLADRSHRVRIADGTLEVRHQTPVEELTESEAWVAEIEDLVKTAGDFDDALDA